MCCFVRSIVREPLRYTLEEQGHAVAPSQAIGQSDEYARDGPSLPFDGRRISLLGKVIEKTVRKSDCYFGGQQTTVTKNENEAEAEEAANKTPVAGPSLFWEL